MFKKLPSIALRKVLTSTGPHVCSLQAAPMPIPRPAPPFTSRAFYAGNMIYSLFDRLIRWRGSRSFLPAPQDGNFFELLFICVACFGACWPWPRSRHRVKYQRPPQPRLRPPIRCPTFQSRETDDQAAAGIERRKCADRPSGGLDSSAGLSR
jgi:hypothetical protein